MKNTLRRLITTIDYIFIRHPFKHRYVWTIPFTISSLMTLTYILIPIKPCFTCPSGITEQVSGLLNMLTGFYIAALAVVATSPSVQLDSITEGTPLQLKKNGKLETLTRRRFLCLMFSYSVSLSLFLSLVGFMSETIAKNLLYFFPDQYFAIKNIIIAFYFFILSQLFTTTLFGIYYISDKIHRKPTTKSRPR